MPESGHGGPRCLRFSRIPRRHGRGGPAPGDLHLHQGGPTLRKGLGRSDPEGVLAGALDVEDSGGSLDDLPDRLGRLSGDIKTDG